MKTFAIIGKPHASGMGPALLDIARFLESHGQSVLFENLTAKQYPNCQAFACAPIENFANHVDIAIVVGGDGTMLAIARQLAPFHIPLIGVHHGRLGFMTDIAIDKMLPALTDLLDNHVESEQRFLLEARIIRSKQALACVFALNDVVISHAAPNGMAELSVEVDGQFMYNQRSDGLIIATPTGSTAYALSVGGPLLHPNLGGIVLAPIAPHTLSNRPIVVPDHSQIVVTTTNEQDIRVNFDMQSLTHLKHGDQIMIHRSPHTVTFLHPVGWNYYATLRKKLHWNEYHPSLSEN